MLKKGTAVVVLVLVAYASAVAVDSAVDSAPIEWCHVQCDQQFALCMDLDQGPPNIPGCRDELDECLNWCDDPVWLY